MSQRQALAHGLTGSSHSVQDHLLHLDILHLAVPTSTTLLFFVLLAILAVLTEQILSRTVFRRKETAGAAAFQKSHSSSLRSAMRADVALSASYWCLISAYVLPFIIASNNVIMFGHLRKGYNMSFNLSIALRKKCHWHRRTVLLARVKEICRLWSHKVRLHRPIPR